MLLEFYGEGCPNCKKMNPLVKKLEKEQGVVVEKYEVWNNEENVELMKKYSSGRCEGVPFFWNDNSQEHICGSTDYEKLKEWALGV